MFDNNIVLVIRKYFELMENGRMHTARTLQFFRRLTTSTTNNNKELQFPYHILIESHIYTKQKKLYDFPYQSYIILLFCLFFSIGFCGVITGLYRHRIW